MYRKYIKRMLDFVLSLIAIVILSPVFLVVGILIKLEDKGPILFKQLRPGMGMELFEIYKFRTMCNDAVRKQKAGVEVIGKDQRITKFGYFLRRFKIDELAQLLNILKGEMSIVGPRPSLPDYLDEYEEWELRRFEVRPGLTGLAQINGNIYLDRKKRSRFDVEYVDHVTLINDIKIVIKTFAIVFLGEEKFVNKED